MTRRLIDADAFRREIDTYPPFDKKTQDSNAMANFAKEVLLVALNNMPTIDAVPVIRCKDCVYFTPEKSGEHWNVCRFYDAPKTADGYCNDAEPKENEE